MKTLLMVASGGALGSALRYLSQKVLNQNMGLALYSSTMLINVLGCFLIGIFATFLSLKKPELAPFFITGILGGFTTFSAFGLDSVNLMQQRQMGNLMLYIGVSVVVGILFTWFGIKFAQLYLINK